MASEKDIEERIEHPAAAEAEHEARLTPVEAIARMRINLPVRGNRKLRTLVERVNDDQQLKAWWHVSNVNAVARMEINDHSWVHIQIVANIALKLLRQLTKHGVESAMVRDYGMTNDDAEVVVTLAALAAAIEDVTITDGDDRPILIEIRMNNSSGLFQVDGLLRAKLRGSGLEPYVEVVAHIDTETEQRLVPLYRLEI
jgi:metal-dependent HD superfamily phosphatase/phosphodiesterase